HVDAGEIESRLVRRYREQRLVDHLAERTRGDPDLGTAADARTERKLGEVLRRKAHHLEARATGHDLDPAFRAGTQRQLVGGHLARDLVELPRVHRGGAALLRGGGQLAAETDLHVGGDQGDPTVDRLDQHMGKDGLRVATLDDALHEVEALDQILPFDAALPLTPRPAPGFPDYPRAS